MNCASCNRRAWRLRAESKKRLLCAGPILVCSTNAGKLRDFRLAAALAQTNVQFETAPDFGAIEPPEETGRTFEENAMLKALYYSQRFSECVLADDSGLEVMALGGAPGIYSARFAGPHASDGENNRLLLERLRNVTAREARFVCSLALARRGHLLLTAEASVAGSIREAPEGSEGFGYDPLFFYPPLGRSFGQLGPEEKWAVSHRGRAFGGLLEKLAAPQSGLSVR